MDDNPTNPGQETPTPTSETASNTEAQTTRRRGFAAMSPERQKEIAAMGGRASHRLGRGHEWNRDAAREAGRKGGLASHSARRRRLAEPVTSEPTTTDTVTPPDETK